MRIAPTILVVLRILGHGDSFLRPLRLSSSSSLSSRNKPQSSFALSSSITGSTEEEEEDSAPSDVEANDSQQVFQDNEDDNRSSSSNSKSIQTQLLQLAASFDRGFAASPAARTAAHQLLKDLALQLTATNVAATILNDEKDAAEPPQQGPTLLGTWRLIWTSGLDVLSLNASPIFQTGAIHQVFEKEASSNKPLVTNVIDLIPRIQSLFPPALLPNTALRATVQTQACRPSTNDDKNNRVGLIFQTVQVRPLQVFGLEVTNLPPLLDVNLPPLPGTDGSSSPGYLEVMYLDEELLVYQQTQPGGLFALLRVDSLEDV